MQDAVRNDIAVARKHLVQHDGLKVVAVKGGDVIGSGRGKGILPLLNLVDELGPELEGGSVADRVIGRAAAFILLQAKVKGVFGQTLSTEAESLLQAAGLEVAGDERVPFIMRPDGLERCIMEQQVLGITEPAEAVDRLRRFVERLHNR